MKIDIVQKQAARKYKTTMTITMPGEGNGLVEKSAGIKLRTVPYLEWDMQHNLCPSAKGIGVPRP